MGVWSRLREAFSTRDANIITADQLVGWERERRLSTGSVHVTNETALRHSGVWAAVRLRADLVSTMPLDVFRMVHGQQVEMPKPPILVTPGGESVGLKEWLYSTQVDLDRAGNTFGIITERSGLIGPDGRGLPARIDLCALSDVTVKAKGTEITDIYVGKTRFDPWEIWHEKQYTVAGLPVGLSPVAFSAWNIEESLNAQKFAREWFGAGAIPLAELTNTAKKINKDEAQVAKAAFRASVETGDIFVHGNDWTYKPIQSVASQSGFMEARQHGITDIIRFFGVPADLIDAAVSGSSVTYATITERNLQFLIMNLAPVIARREEALSRLIVGPRFVKLNSDALLRMNPEARARTMQIRINSRTLTPNQARALDNQPPLTEADLAEFDRVFGPPRTTPTTAAGVPQ
jgi:HK97 family phage portal protein